MQSTIKAFGYAWELFELLQLFRTSPADTLYVEANELEFISVTMQDPFTKVNNNKYYY